MTVEGDEDPTDASAADLRGALLVLGRIIGKEGSRAGAAGVRGLRIPEDGAARLLRRHRLGVLALHVGGDGISGDGGRLFEALELAFRRARDRRIALDRHARHLETSPLPVLVWDAFAAMTALEDAALAVSEAIDVASR